MGGMKNMRADGLISDVEAFPIQEGDASLFKDWLEKCGHNTAATQLADTLEYMKLVGLDVGFDPTSLNRIFTQLPRKPRGSASAPGPKFGMAIEFYSAFGYAIPDCDYAFDFQRTFSGERIRA